MRIGVVGHKSAIAQDFMAMQKRHHEFVTGRAEEIAWTHDAYLICCGSLVGKSLSEMTEAQANLTWQNNFFLPAKLCEQVLRRNDKARICVIGSMSGCQGSYDMAYAGAKAALHLYVERTKIRPEQRLFGLAPAIISDAGMTTRRKDEDRVQARARAHRTGRHVTVREVAIMASLGLFTATTFVSNTVIKLGGDVA